MNWHNAKKEQPKADGEYLCICENLGKRVITLKFTQNLCRWISAIRSREYRDIQRRKDKSGWYTYSRTYDFFEICDVVAWMELPPIYKEK